MKSQIDNERQSAAAAGGELPKDRKVATGDGIMTAAGRWSFAGDVPRAFDDHVRKSVPFYAETHQLVLKLSDFFLSRGSLCYDLGCSTGSLSAAIAARHADRGVSIVGVDAEPAMTGYARSRHGALGNLTFCEGDLSVFELDKADMIIACFTVQFVHPKFRQDLINRIYQSLNWGGALIMFEKVRAPDARFQDMMTQIYNEFKQEQGYSADEILGKSVSLKGVLEPFSTQGNRDLLARAGFVDVMTVMKYVCFEGFLAIK